jgi:hypothetical protein
VVRQNVGYAATTPAELEALRQLYGVLRLYVNFFQPQMKLLSKIRQGARVTKRFDEARTPYRRALASPHVSEAAKRAPGYLPRAQPRPTRGVVRPTRAGTGWRAAPMAIPWQATLREPLDPR